MSDFHLDPRYKIGSEGNCTSGLCCRSNVKNSAPPPGQISFLVPEFGYFECDTPYNLGLAALQAVGPLTGTSKSDPLAWTIYTGGLVSHVPQSELSRAYVEYAETSVFNYLLKKVPYWARISCSCEPRYQSRGNQCASLFAWATRTTDELELRTRFPPLAARRLDWRRASQRSKATLRR